MGIRRPPLLLLKYNRPRLPIYVSPKSSDFIQRFIDAFATLVDLALGAILRFTSESPESSPESTGS